MPDDDLFRLAAVGVCLVFMPIGLYHRICSHTCEKIDRWQEGAWILFGLRLTGLVFFASGIAWLIEPAWLAWSSLPIPVAFRWCGVALAVCGGGVWVWAVHSLGKNLTDTVVTRQAHTLVTTGAYRWVRHPFYTGCAIGLAGASLMTANWFIAVTAGVAWFVFLVPRTRIEERKLIERFGEEYRRYMEVTGRFVPRLGK